MKVVSMKGGSSHLETKLGDNLAILAGLGRGRRRGELDIVDTELVKSLGATRQLDTRKDGIATFEVRHTS